MMQMKSCIYHPFCSSFLLFHLKLMAEFGTEVAGGEPIFQCFLYERVAPIICFQPDSLKIKLMNENTWGFMVS